jgi:hypothetical protein
MAQSRRNPQICEADAEAALEASTRKNGDVPSIRLMIDIHRYPDLQKSGQSKMMRCLWKLMKTRGLELREGSHGAVSAVARWRSEILWRSSCLVGTVPVVLVCFRILTICQVISSISSRRSSLCDHTRIRRPCFRQHGSLALTQESGRQESGRFPKIGEYKGELWGYIYIVVYSNQVWNNMDSDGQPWNFLGLPYLQTNPLGQLEGRLATQPSPMVP